MSQPNLLLLHLHPHASNTTLHVSSTDR